MHGACRGESCCQVPYCKRCENQNQIGSQATKLFLMSPALSCHFVGNRTNTQSGVMLTQKRLKLGSQPRLLPGNLSLRCHFFLESGVRVGLWEAGGCKASFPFCFLLMQTFPGAVVQDPPTLLKSRLLHSELRTLPLGIY